MTGGYSITPRMSTIGSVVGCLLTDLVLRPLGARGLERYLAARRIKRMERKVRDNGGRTLAVASLVPPLFPFTAFVMASAALQYSRARMLTVIGATRMVRFTLLGALALRFGAGILRWAKNPIMQAFLVGLIGLRGGQRVLGFYTWIRAQPQAGRGAPRVTKRTQCRLKYCTSRSCFSAFSRVGNVPRFLRLPVAGSAFRE